LATPVCAGEIEGVVFDDTSVVGDRRVELAGVALLRYRIFIKAYVGALYLESGIGTGRVLEDVPKRLVLHYRYTIPGDGFGPAAEEILATNFSPGELAPLRDRLARLHALYQTVHPGDRYTLTYIPGVGTELALNDRSLGVMEGADFAAAYFSIWLGEEPISAAFRDQMLAGL
jgi:hypothetical protein